jgi:hypothetical protein
LCWDRPKSYRQGGAVALSLQCANQRRTSLLAFRQSWLLGLLSALSIAAACSREEADLQWGANGHPLNAYPGVTYEQQLDYLKDLGMKSYRVNIAGPQWAPALAKLLEHAKAREIGILPVITPALDLDNSQHLNSMPRPWTFVSGSLATRWRITPSSSHAKCKTMARMGSSGTFSSGIFTRAILSGR